MSQRRGGRVFLSRRRYRRFFLFFRFTFFFSALLFFFFFFFFASKSLHPHPARVPYPRALSYYFPPKVQLHVRHVLRDARERRGGAASRRGKRCCCDSPRIIVADNVDVDDDANDSRRRHRRQSFAASRSADGRVPPRFAREDHAGGHRASEIRHRERALSRARASALGRRDYRKAQPSFSASAPHLYRCVFFSPGSRGLARASASLAPPPLSSMQGGFAHAFVGFN